VVREDVIAVC
jgi:hypothetical protein